MADCQTWTHQVETALVRPTWVRSRIKRFPGINVGFEGLKGTAQEVARISGNVTKLKPKQEEAIIALLTNRSVEDAARSVNVAPRTLYRWLSEPLFDKAYRKARREAFGQGTARLQQASGAAVSSILKIMLDQHAPASTKLRAADMVLSHGAKAIEIEDIEARVAELERAAEAAQASQDDGVTA